MRRALLLLTPAIALVAAGCATDGRAARADEAITSTTAPPVSIDGFDPDQVVWQAAEGGGYLPTAYAAAEVPQVTIYGDGRIITVDRSEDTPNDHPAALALNQIPATDLEAFLSKAVQSGLFEEGVDFGDPDIMDVGGTSVTLDVGDGPRTLGVYALGFSGSEPGTSDWGVSESQAKRRNALVELLHESAGLAGGTGEEYIPDRVQATMIVGGSLEEDAPPPAPWPDGSFDQFPAVTDGYGEECLVIEGEQAQEVYLAAVQNEGISWTDGATTAEIVVAPLVPGQEGCAD